MMLVLDDGAMMLVLDELSIHQPLDDTEPSHPQIGVE